MPKAIEQIRQKLTDAFEPLAFELVDHSAKHAGHAGNPMGGSHIAVYLVSQAFEGVPTLKRHRMVHAVLKEDFKGALHAVELDLKAPMELP
ncbi:MAG: BolA family transcriptional regulator [Vampirovibrio sp.]